LDPSQDLPKPPETIKLYFVFKYYIDTYQDLQDHMTIELLYLQARKSIEKGEIVTDEQTIYELSALVMQANYGPYTNDDEGLKLLQNIPIIPAYIFQKQSVKICEEQILRYYKLIESEKLSRGEAILKYLEIVQSLPMYSFHYFEVKDKNNTPLWLGVGPNGIVQCLYDNRNEPVAHYQWINLQNIYYKDKKFSVEVYTNAKSPRKAGHHGGNTVTLLAWYGKNPKVVVAIWKMVRDQHVFYRQRRSNKTVEIGPGDPDDSKTGMTMTEIVRQMNRKHRHGNSISPSSSHSSLSIESAKSNQATGASVEAIAAAKKAQQEMYGALLSTREELIDMLEKKLVAYKDLLIKEMHITGVPPEGLTAEEIEKMRTKFGINFKFSKFVLDRGESVGEGDAVEELQKQLEVQSAIIEASKTLVEQAKSRHVKKDRKKEVKRAEERYQRLEDKLSELKRSQRRSLDYRDDTHGFTLPPPLSSTGSLPTRRSNRQSSPNSGSTVDDSFLAKIIFDDPSPHNFSPLVSNSQRSHHHKSTSALHDINELPRPSSPPIHRQLSSTRSTGFSYYTESSPNKSYNSQLSDLNDSYYLGGSLERSPRPSISSTGSSRYEDSGLRMSNLTEDLLHHYTPNRSSGHYVSSQMRSSPESLHTPSSRPNSGYRGSTGVFSPEPLPPNSVSILRQRPQSTHSLGTPPPSNPYDRANSQPPHPNMGMFKNRELNLEEALLMDQDEGTLV
jgi:hypothetical protein